MKKFLLFLLVALLLTACAHEQEVIVKRGCGHCNAQYTVRRPVEIVYEDTSYITVYEPKTYTMKKRVSVPYSCR